MTVENNLTSSSNNSELIKRSIEILPEHLIDQIKAGEVIERASSLLKEILENSIDAKATEIDLHLINNGLDLIALTDNGKGMIFDELPYAFCRHATSKISRFEDIYHLHSYGFRGEALASICAIARVTCTSSPGDQSPQGGRIIIEGGETKAHAPLPQAPKGTSLFIKDLFFNTPARLKFIKSATSERNALKRIIDSFVVSHPEIKFTIKWDDEDKIVYPIEESFEARLKKVFYGRNKKLNLFSFKGEYEDHTVFGFLSETSSRSAAHKKQFLFANDRLFTDRQIHQSILRSAERIYPQGENGHYCVFIKAPENLIDVNIHPSKTQIKFFKLPVITALVSSEIKKLQAERPVESQSSFQINPQNQNQFSFSTGTSQTPVQRAVENNSYQPQVSHKVAFDHDLSLFSWKEKIFLLSRERLFQNIFNVLKGQSFSPDKDFVPLLISEPVYLPEGLKIDIPLLEKVGFLVDQLQEDSLVIRAVHQNFRNWNDLQGLILYFLTNDPICLEGVSITTKDFTILTESLDLDWGLFMREVDEKLYHELF